MLELPLIAIGSDGLRQDGRPWLPHGPWVGALQTGGGDRRPALLAVAARARDEALTVVRVEPSGAEPETVLSTLSDLAPDHRPRGLLLGESWQEIVAARCATLTGTAAALGLADAVRIDADEGWQGHHLLAGAAEAFLAQIWPGSAGPLPRAVVLGGGATATAAAVVAAHRGAASVTLVVTDPRRRDDLAMRLAAAVDWPPACTWEVVGHLEAETETSPSGIWIRTVADTVIDPVWLPDAAGDGPCIVVDLAGTTANPPLGFAHPAASGVQVMAAGLAAAWYLGPPVPWDALSAEPV